MKASPSVSILIPNYNHGNYLSETIESVLNQSFQDFEVIIADNASTDNSREVIESYTKRDARITGIFHGSNLGPIPNWISALQKASGYYCKILFSDDKLAPDYLNAAVAALGDDSVGFFYSAVQSFGDNDHQYFKFSQSGKFASVAFLKGHLLYRMHLPVSPACALFRTSDVRRYLDKLYKDQEEIGHILSASNGFPFRHVTQISCTIFRATWLIATRWFLPLVQR